MKQVREIEMFFHRGHGLIELICGPMFSGKTEELIKRIRRVEFARQNGLVFKPKIDKRYSLEDEVVSHSSLRLRSAVVSNSQEIRHILQKEGALVDVVGIDEAQFFDDGVIGLCEQLADRGMRVIVAGLAEDYLGQPFGPLPRLLAHADSISKLWAVCMCCGAPASKTQRIVADGKTPISSQVLVGASESYEARCRQCHVKDITHPVVKKRDSQPRHEALVE